VLHQRPALAAAALASCLTLGTALQPLTPIESATEREYIRDYAALLTQPQEGALRGLLDIHNHRGPGTILLLIVTELPPNTTIGGFAFANASEGYALEVYEKSNQILIVIALRDRQIRIETSRDVSVLLPEQFLSSVIYDVILPPFRRAAYFDGIRDGIVSLIDRLEQQGQSPLLKPTAAGEGHTEGLRAANPILATVPSEWVSGDTLTVSNLNFAITAPSGWHWGQKELPDTQGKRVTGFVAVGPKGSVYAVLVWQKATEDREHADVQEFARGMAKSLAAGWTVLDVQVRSAVPCAGSSALRTRLRSPDGQDYYLHGYVVPGRMTYHILAFGPDETEPPEFLGFACSLTFLDPTGNAIQLMAGGVKANERRVSIFQERQISVSVPTGWRLEESRDPRTGIQTLRLVDPRSEIRVDVSFFPDPEDRLVTREGLEAEMRKAFAFYLTGAVEREMKFASLDVTSGIGEYTFFTDRSLSGREIPEGERLISTVGIRSWKGAYLIFTLLSNSRDAVPYRLALEFIRTGLKEVSGPNEESR
jgi:uncharacterized membrane protein YgcG